MPHLYITHPEVVIDPNVPTPRWGLNATGWARARAFAARRLLPDDAIFYASDEQKALDLAQALAGPLGTIIPDPQMGENDRASTGYLPPERFEAMVDRLFGDPQTGPDGWESALHAQQRIVTAVQRALATHPPDRQAVFVGHGCVGTLLKCHVGGRAIARHEDQRVRAAKGGGNIFAFELSPRRLLGDWQALEEFELRSD
jgi:broad specificity phosphatase PhoE